MKYTNCPTCGSLCKYISSNFEKAGILISSENEHYKKLVEITCKHMIEIEQIAASKVSDLNSNQLYFLFTLKLQQEIKHDQTKIDETYLKTQEEVDKLTNSWLRDLNKRMLEL